jgi:RNA polymerase sigma-70 factor (ECF subfamily)
MLLDTTESNDQHTFQQLAEPYRRELQLHCYRMLGSLYEAEDLVQETFLRAWRSRDRFEGRTSLRNWLYRIATNACLNTLASQGRSRRILVDTTGTPPEGYPSRRATEIAWLEPYPDAWLEGITDTAPGPDARYEMREAVRLAFVAAIQHLPARQRAVLLLRDVLGWSAIETALLLDTSVIAVNSALQRARTTLETHYPAHQTGSPQLADEHERALLDRYVRAWETADLDGFVALLKDDAVLTMPPFREWYLGRDAIRAFFTWAWPRTGQMLLTLTAANGQPALAQYFRSPDGLEWRAHALQVLTLRDGAIAAMTIFREPQLFVAFGCPVVVRYQKTT